MDSYPVNIFMFIESNHAFRTLLTITSLFVTVVALVVVGSKIDERIFLRSSATTPSWLNLKFRYRLLKMSFKTSPDCTSNLQTLTVTGRSLPLATRTKRTTR